jgi:hypothetical protein
VVAYRVSYARCFLCREDRETLFILFFYERVLCISTSTRPIALHFGKLNMIDFTKTCAIPSLSGSHTKGPQPTNTVLTPCTTLPEFQAVSLSSQGRARAVHIVGTAAGSHQFFLLSYCYLDLALWGRWMCLS